MAEHLTQSLVDLRRPRPTPERVAELALNHVEGRFHVRTLVVVSHKPLLVVGVEVEHALEEVAAILARAVGLEGYVRHRACSSSYQQRLPPVLDVDTGERKTLWQTSSS